MSMYTDVRCKCVVKEEYRTLIGDILKGKTSSHFLKEYEYIQRLLKSTRFGAFFNTDNSSPMEEINEVAIPFLYDVQTGEWHFHTSINKEYDEVEKFLVYFNSKFLKKIFFFETYDEYSVDDFLDKKRDTYLTTDKLFRMCICDHGVRWMQNISCDQIPLSQEEITQALESYQSDRIYMYKSLLKDIHLKDLKENDVVYIYCTDDVYRDIENWYYNIKGFPGEVTERLVVSTIGELLEKLKKQI